MGKAVICDICGKATARIVTKLYLVPVNGNLSVGHDSYTARAEVGECCGSKIVELAKWQKRKVNAKKEPEPVKKGKGKRVKVA